MSLASGARLGPYEILAKLGEGGMGEVYRARDARLGRDVALKIIPEAVASDPDRVARFEREAKTLASLSHPNIAILHGIENNALVMELVEGEDLSSLISRGLSIDELLPIARQIADALEAAHEQNIIHRDLKPQNVKVRPDGTVKVLDFGLAKALTKDPALSTQNDQNSPTITNRATELGVILGTATYMAPEQARGRPVDRRADIWAFGVVLYEMLSGRRAFQGDDVSITLANVLKESVDWSALPANTPPALRRLIERCLDKDPKKRLGWIGEARFVLDNPAAVAESAAPVLAGTVRRPKPWLAWVLAALSTIAAVAILIAWNPWRQAPISDPRRLFTDIGVKASIQSVGIGASAILSSDGKTLVFVAAEFGESMLYVRRLDELSAQKLAGTEGAFEPFLSPRGDWIGFFTVGQMKKIPLTGGAVTNLATAGNGRGATWLDDDTIVFAPSPGRGPLMRMPAAGGTPVPFATLSDQARSQRYPQVLPGSTHVLFGESVADQSWDNANVMVQPVAGGPAKVVANGHYARFVAIPGDRSRGYLLYATQGVVSAAPFDLTTMAVTGPAFQAIDGAMTNSQTGGGQYDASSEGTLVYVRGAAATLAATAVLWLGTDGKATPLRSTAAQWSDPRFSPDGKLLALTIADARQSDVWLYEMATDTIRRLTFDAARDQAPVWSPDGKRIAFASDRDKPGGATNIYVANADGSGVVTRLTQSENAQTPGSWHPFRPEILFGETRSGRADIMALPLAIDPATGGISGAAPRPFLTTPANEGFPMISPDGRWVAYFSDPNSGLPDVYVRPYAGSGGPWQITTDSCVFPQWSAKSSELLCWSIKAARIMAASYTAAGDSFRAGKPRVWAAATVRPANPRTSVFALHPDGQRVAVGTVASNSELVDKVVLFLNFADYLKGLARK